MKDGHYVKDEDGKAVYNNNGEKIILPEVMKQIHKDVASMNLKATRKQKWDAILESRYKSNQANKKGNQNLLKKNQDQSQYDNLKTIMQRGHIPQGEQGIGSLPD